MMKDNLFNGFPGADTVREGRSHEGLVRLHALSLNSPADVDHQHKAFVREYDGGRMDGWDEVDTLPKEDPDYSYAYVPRQDVEPYWDMAERFTFADRMFQSNSGPSYPAHLYLVAGQSEYVANNPNHIETGHYAWGCDSPRNATVSVIGPHGSERKGPYPCLDFRTIADELDERGVSWRYYSPAIVVSPETRVLTDAQDGDLPAVTWVVPTAQNSDHPFPKVKETGDLAVGVQHGPQWVASIVNAITLPLHSSTVWAWDRASRSSSSLRTPSGTTFRTSGTNSEASSSSWKTFSPCRGSEPRTFAPTPFATASISPNPTRVSERYRRRSVPGTSFARHGTLRPIATKSGLSG